MSLIGEQEPGAKRRDSGDLELGGRIKALRQAKGLSTRALSASSDLSAGLISQIERGMTAPSLRSLRQISEALEVPIVRFFEGEQPPSDESAWIVRRENRRLLRLSETGVAKELVSPSGGDVGLEAMRVTIQPNGTSGEKNYNHPGDEAGYVVKGVLDLWINDRLFVLRAGDGFRFPSTLPHRFANTTGEFTEVIWAVTPPYWGG